MVQRVAPDSLRDQRPSQFLMDWRNHSTTPQYMPNWDDVTEDEAALLAQIVDGFKTKEPYSVLAHEMDTDAERGWALCAFWARGLVEIDVQLLDRRISFYPRFGLLARSNTHGFKITPKTGDPDVAQPHRPRAINLED